MIDFNYRTDDYVKLLHAVQSGVAAFMERNASEVDPKHLRVGINSSLISTSALVLTLAEAGVITFEAFRDNEIMLIQNEVRNYEAKLSEELGTQVHLI